MNQTVRTHDPDANSLGPLLRAALGAAPHSPEYDKIVENIDLMQLPTWQPQGAAQSVHNRQHHMRLAKVTQILAPRSKPSWIQRLGVKPPPATLPSLAALGAALHEIEAYLDDAQLSLSAVEREYQALEEILDKLQIIQNRLTKFEEGLRAHRANHEATAIFKAIADKSEDIARMIAIYHYTRSSFQLGVTSQRHGMEHAALMKKAINFVLTSGRAIKTADNKILHATAIPKAHTHTKSIDANRIIAKPEPEKGTAEELQQLTENLELSIAAQKQAIDVMTETSKAATALSD